MITPFLDGKRFLLTLSNLFSILGRIAFPLFIFFVVEGFFKTRDRKRYFLTLLIFGLMAEVSFDLFTSKTIFQPNWNNIMFAMALGLLTIWIIDSIKSKFKNKALWYIVSIIIVVAFGFIAMALSLDYDTTP